MLLDRFFSKSESLPGLDKLWFFQQNVQRKVLRLKLRFVIFVMFGAFIVPCKATLLFEDEFQYPTGAVNGASGGSGFSGAWSNAGSVLAPGLTYENLTVSSNAFLTGGSNVGAFRNLTNSYGGGSGTFYFSVVVGMNAALPDYAGLSLFNGGTEVLFIGKPNGQAQWGVDLKPGKIATASNVNVNTTVFLVAQIDFAAVNDTIKLWVDPPLTNGLGTADLSSTRSDFSFNQIRFQSGSAGAHTDVYFDEVRMGTTVADIMPVPEPSSILILFLGGLSSFFRWKSARKSWESSVFGD